jgi:MFS family permease
MIALGQGALGFVGHSALISYWFIRRRATAIGIASMGQGFGALIMVTLTELLISRIGWRATYMFTAFFILLTLVPANALLQRRYPCDVGQYPDGDPAPLPQSSVEPATRPRPGVDWTLRKYFCHFHFGAFPGHLALGTVFSHHNPCGRSLCR